MCTNLFFFFCNNKDKEIKHKFHLKVFANKFSRRFYIILSIVKISEENKLKAGNKKRQKHANVYVLIKFLFCFL